jgi:hypothetical protein
MNFLGLFFLLVIHFVTGRGIVELFKTDLAPLRKICVSFIIGVGVASFIPFFMELFHLEITAISLSIIFITLALASAVPLIPKLKNFKFSDLGKIKAPELYEFPFIVIFLLLIALSIWRCYYNPPFAWDMLSGPEVMADVAVKEKHIINSLFSVDLQFTNNYLKPPYVTSLQLIYKLFVQQFGQLWLSVLFVSFITLIFSLLREKLHPVIMYFVMLLFFAMPETYAYSYIILFDYSNMIFFFLGCFFLNRYFEHLKTNDFAFSLLAFCFATYVRSETLVLLVMMLPIIVFRLWKLQTPWLRIGIRSALFVIAPYVVYFLLMNIYVSKYIPIHFDVSSQVNKNLGDVSVFTKRFSDMVSELVFGEYGVMYFGYFNYTFVIVFILDIVLFRKYTSEAITAVYSVFIVFIGLAFLGYLLPLVDLNHTTKRGMFKMFPLMLLYFRNSGVLGWLSTLINNWEAGKLSDDAGEKPPYKPRLAKNTPPLPQKATTGAVKQVPIPQKGTKRKSSR